MQLKSSLISFNHHFDSPVIPTEREKEVVDYQRLPFSLITFLITSSVIDLGQNKTVIAHNWA